MSRNETSPLTPIDELYGDKITVVRLVLTKPNPIDFVKNYDKIGI